MSERVFVDSGILLCAHDLDAGEKRAIAEHVLRQIWQDESGVVSADGLREFYVALTAGDSPVPRRAARDLVAAYSVWTVVALDAADIAVASEFEERYRLPFPDALTIAAARKSRATLLLSDRVMPSKQITGLEVRNPFI